MKYTAINNIVMLVGNDYSLGIDTEKATAKVIVGGVSVAVLDLRSAVNKLGDGMKPIVDSEPEKPEFLGVTENGGLIRVSLAVQNGYTEIAEFLRAVKEIAEK